MPERPPRDFQPPTTGPEADSPDTFEKRTEALEDAIFELEVHTIHHWSHDSITEIPPLVREVELHKNLITRPLYERLVAVHKKIHSVLEDQLHRKHHATYEGVRQSNKHLENVLTQSDRELKEDEAVLRKARPLRLFDD